MMASIAHVFISIFLLLSSVALIFGSLIFGNERLFGGNRVEYNQFPFVVSIRNETHYKCGGSILSEKFILTNAICFENDNNPSLPFYRVLVDSRNRNDNSAIDGTAYEVKRIVRHPEYLNSGDVVLKEIAIIELAKSIQFAAENVQSIEMDREEFSKTDEKSITFGWTEDGSSNNFYLSYMYVNTLTYTDCRKIISWKTYALNYYNLCAIGDKGAGVQLQDIGYPLVHNNKLIGVKAWSRQTTTKLPAGGYLSINAFISWIDKTIRGSANV